MKTDIKEPAKPLPQPRLYVGDATCDLVPEWDDALSSDAIAFARGLHGSDPEDITNLEIFADCLADCQHLSESWVRAGVELWRACGILKPGRKSWDYMQAKAEFEGVTNT